MQKVYITGAEVTSSIGSNYSEFILGIENAKRGIGKITHFNTEHFPSDFAAEIKDHSLSGINNSKIDRKVEFIKNVLNNLFGQFEFIDKYEPEDRYLHLGAGLDYFDLQNYAELNNKQNTEWRKYSNNTNLIVKQLAKEHDINGGYTVNVTACVASSQAVGLAYRQLKYSTKNLIAIAGGFDSMINTLHYMGFYKLGALSSWNGNPEEACRPFDKNRCGLVLGEGAAALIIQNDLSTPQNIQAEIVGYASTMDSYMVSDPKPDGTLLGKAALDAIKEAGLTPSDIDCAHLHGTGTIKNALAETNAMRIIFGDRFSEIPVFSLKGQVGHLISACGAVELLAAIYSLQNQKVPITVNYSYPDPEVPLRVIKNKALDHKINHVLKLNSAFGGQNTAFILKKYE